MENTSYRAIAIVGAGAILPDAPNVPAFWENIKNGRYSITEVEPDRWDPALYYDPDHSAPDKTYSKIGGWVRDYRVGSDEVAPAHPARVVDAMDGAQKWAIACTREALEDYGYPKRPLDPGSHGRDPGQCHGRGEALSHRVAHVLSGIRPRVGGKRQFRGAAGSGCAATSPANCTSGSASICPRLPKTACPANWPTALPAALRTSSTSTAQLRLRRGVRLGDGGDQLRQPKD